MLTGLANTATVDRPVIALAFAASKGAAEDRNYIGDPKPTPGIKRKPKPKRKSQRKPKPKWKSKRGCWNRSSSPPSEA